MSSAIEKIGKRTKQIREAHPGISFRSAQQKASAEYRAGKLGAVRKKSAPKKKAAKKKAAKKKSLKRSRSRSYWMRSCFLACQGSKPWPLSLGSE